jgi:hypothetical protein
MRMREDIQEHPKKPLKEAFMDNISSTAEQDEDEVL